MIQPVPQFPDKLCDGDMVRVIAPSLSLGSLSQEIQSIANERFQTELGLTVTYSERSTGTSPIEDRIADLHDAFADTEVKAIFSANGGYATNQMLRRVDWDLLKENPKVFCGFSDVNALGNAILSRTGLVTYSGPHYASLGQKKFDSYTTEYLRTALFERGKYDITPSQEWTDVELWYLHQEERNPMQNEGTWAIQPGEAEGIVIGGNLCTTNLLQGTEYFPSSPETIGFVEDTHMSSRGFFDRDLQSLLHAQAMKGIVIGRFQRDSKIGRSEIESIIRNKAELNDVPVVANVDFGHTFPMATYPLGGRVALKVSDSQTRTTIINQQEEEQ
jgi:muramoyltetrapeptide carboxypeptidase